MHLNRYIMGLITFVVLTGTSVLAAPSVSPTATVTSQGIPDWPPMRVTYETTLVSTPGSSMENRRVNDLTYISRDEWRMEAVDATFGAGAPGDSWEFKDGVFSQNIDAAGRVITEEIPEGSYAVPERWLHLGRMQSLESLGYQATPVNKRQVRYEYVTNLPCGTIPEQFWPDGCRAGGTVTEVETIIAMVGIYPVPFPVEYSYTLDGEVRMHAAMLEIVMLDADHSLN